MKLVKILFCAILSIILLCSSSREQWTIEEYSSGDLNSIVMEAGTSNAKNLCFVSDSENRFIPEGIVPGRYMILEDRIQRKRPLEGEPSISVRETEELISTIVSVPDGKILKQIDVLELFEREGLTEQLEGYQDATMMNSPLQIGEQIYLIVWLSSRLSEPRDVTELEEFIYVLVDIETEATTILDSVDEYRDLEDTDENLEYLRKFYVMYDLMDERGKTQTLYELNGFPHYGLEPEGVIYTVNSLPNESWAQLTLTSNYLPNENNLLYSEFPGLKEYIGLDGYTIRMYLADYPDPDILMSYIMEEGQEISFDGAYISAEDSIDRKVHKINSFEDFYNLRKPLE